MEIKKINLLVAMLVCLASCSDDETVDNNALPDDGNTTTVKFEMNARTGNFASVSPRGITLPEITKDNFRILAFKKSPLDGRFLYAQDVPLNTLNFSGALLSGTVRLPIGEYKFLSTYGLAKDGGFALPALTPLNTELTDDLRITHNKVDGSSVFFLEEGPLENLRSYALGLNPGENEPVSASLTRGVARVDILFLQAKKNDDGITYTEVTDSTDVFGASKLANIEMQFTKLNKNVNLVGIKKTNDDASLFDVDFSIPNLENAVTKGASEEDTKVGTKDFLEYDNITGDDIKRGSAHVHGAYVLPYEEAENNTGVQLVLTNGVGDKRIIEVPENLPLERNKVTLIKIYVLSGTVFSTDVKFNITIDTKWLDANSVDGEIQ